MNLFIQKCLTVYIVGCSLIQFSANAQCTNPARLDSSFAGVGSSLTLPSLLGVHTAVTSTDFEGVLSTGVVPGGIFVCRRTGNGNFNNNFGAAGGYITIPGFTYLGHTWAPTGTDIAFLPNGNIAICGYADDQTTQDRVAVYILIGGAGATSGFTSNIGISGINVYTIAGYNKVLASALYSDQSNMYMAGSYATTVAGIEKRQPVIWKLDYATGSLSTGTFGGAAGYVMPSTLSATDDYSITDLDFESGSNNLVVSANYTSSATTTRGYIALINRSNGSQSSNFSVDAHTGATDYTTVDDIKVLSNGLILVTGSAYNVSFTGAYISRIYGSGGADLSFGVSGKKYIYGSSSASGVGKFITTTDDETTIITGGYGYTSGTNTWPFVAKLNALGQPVTTFNNGSEILEFTSTYLNGVRTSFTLSQMGKLILAADSGAAFSNRIKTVRVKLKCDPNLYAMSGILTKVKGTSFSNVSSQSSAPLSYVNSSGPSSIVGINTTTGVFTALHPGNIHIDVSQASNSSYYGGNISFDLTVTKALLTVTANNTSRNYGASNPEFTFSYLGFLNGDDVSDLDTLPSAGLTSTQSSPVGDYDILPFPYSDNEYSFYALPGKLSILKAPLSVRAENKNKVPGSANPALTYTITGFVNGETINAISGSPSLQTSATAASPAGDYVISITSGSLSAANYDFLLFNGTLSIGDNSNLVFPLVSKVYGDAVFDLHATSDAPAPISFVVLSGTGASISSGGFTSIIGAGTLLVAAIQNSLPPFIPATVTSFITINKKPIKVIADDKIIQMGQDNPVFTYYYDGFVNGDNETAINGKPDIASDANSKSKEGDYTISISGSTLSAINYSFGEFKNGKLTVVNITSVASSLDVPLSLYPVPSDNGKLFIETSEFIKEIIISDINGVTEVFNSNNNLHTSLKGVLAVKIVTSNGVYVKRAVVF